MKVKNKNWNYKGFHVRFEHGRWYIYSMTDNILSSASTKDRAKSFINMFCMRD